MKLMSRIFLFLSITGLLAGCKLAVIVVEGGEVRSDSSGTCLGGTICIVDVASPDFHENFEAVPNGGWYFLKWNSGDRFLCGGSTNPICELSFKGSEESKEVADMVASSEVFYLMPVFTLAPMRGPVSDSDTITVNGRVWAQPDLFLNLSWDEINAVCPGGVCGNDAILSGWDVSGWTWASIEDITKLFNFYIGSEKLGPDVDQIYEFDSAWLPKFFDDGWRSAGSDISFVFVGGLTRDSFNVEGWDEAYAPYIAKEARDFGAREYDVANIRMDLNVDERLGVFGAWFYRSPTSN